MSEEKNNLLAGVSSDNAAIPAVKETVNTTTDNTIASSLRKKRMRTNMTTRTKDRLCKVSVVGTILLVLALFTIPFIVHLKQVNII